MVGVGIKGLGWRGIEAPGLMIKVSWKDRNGGSWLLD